MKKGMLFGLLHREKTVKKMNLLHFPVSILKNLPCRVVADFETSTWSRINYIYMYAYEL